MTKLNQDVPEPWPWLYGLLGCAAVICLFMLAAYNGVTGLPVTIAALSLIVGVICLVGFLVSLARYSAHAARRLVASNIMPSAVKIVAPRPLDFQHRGLPELDREPPELNGGFLAVFKGERKLKEHLEYLGDLQNRWSQHLTNIRLKYSKDHSQYEDQQIAIFRMADKAKKLEEFIDQRLSISDDTISSVPQPDLLPLVCTPDLLSRQSYQGRFNNIARLGSAIGRTSSAAGGSPLAAVLVMVGTAALSAKEFQRAIREMHESHEQLAEYISSAKRDLELWSVSHANMVAASERAAIYDRELRKTISWASSVAHQDIDMSQPENVEKILTLRKLSMLSKTAYGRAA